MNLSLAHPSCCGCLPCEERKRQSHVIDFPPNNERPTAESREGNVPQKTCAYGASGNSKPAATVTPKGLEVTASRVSRTGASLSTETKREARRTLTSEEPASSIRETSGTPGEISHIPCGLALTAEKTSGPAPVGFAGKAGSVSGAPRVYASWIDDDPTVAELEFLDDKEDPLAPARGVIFAACMGAVMGGFIVLCVIALFQRVIH